MFQYWKYIMKATDVLFILKKETVGKRALTLPLGSSVENQKGTVTLENPMAIAPFWFSMEHCWIALMPFWLSTDNIIRLSSAKSKHVIYGQLCLSQICWDWKNSFDLEKIQLMRG